MKKIKWNKNSIAYKLTIFMMLLVFGQSVLLTGTLLAGGVLAQTQANAFQSFYEKANNRKDYLQREIKNRWTNMDPYVKEISKLLAILNDPRLSPEERNNNFFTQSAPSLISMLRTTTATGAFVILNDNLQNSNTHSALYFRDYDPMLNDEANNDLYLIVGTPEISKNFQIPMDEVWKYSLTLDENNRDFYFKPMSIKALGINANLLGYWSLPFRLSPNDLPIITYTMPLFNTTGQIFGVIGIEITVSYLNRFLPAIDLFPQDSLGYMIAIQRNKDGGIYPLITNGALQERMIQKNERLSFTSKDMKRNIYLLDNHNSRNKIYACVEKMGLYYYNTPFEQEQWYLIGMMEDNNLLKFVHKIQGILFTSFVISILMGAAGGYLASYQFSKPIILLAKQVQESDMISAASYRKTGLSEIDHLSNAMEIANKNLLESTLKMSQIINLVNVDIGAFEYKKDSTRVFATDRLAHILSLYKQEADELYHNKDLFVKKLHQILNCSEPEEEDVYKISDSPEKWVKIKMIINETRTFGVVSDVTEEIREKNKIKFERDYDSLTKLYNRSAFQRQVVSQLASGNLKVAALIMFDLDYLKQINDTYGHKWGDIYIKTTAELLSCFSTNRCIAGRRSGDEFYVFLYKFDDKDEIRNLIRNFYKKLEENVITFPDNTHKKIMISAGLVWLAKDAVNYDELLHNADSALYKAKNLCKGQLCEFQENQYN
ncbi:diguanylate cyclase [Petroclostridium sp. X23]|uniref:diguanylate cyclase domain-containing protein n=1 Tax=Petroclostridium sp. X23 TaxID=3045146 RepID=UPI0024AE5070|nr:diguanylate cyclase [Petroclostridium sp. X23]WHH61162.1 diguanylate cyclase [Petroclostridium sp. X23]